jgi:hypothetical protein
VTLLISSARVTSLDRRPRQYLWLDRRRFECLHGVRASHERRNLRLLCCRSLKTDQRGSMKIDQG